MAEPRAPARGRGSRAGPSPRSGCCASPGSRRSVAHVPSASTIAACGASRSIHSLVVIGWPVTGSVPSAAQWPSPLISSFGHRALEHEDERVELAGLGVVPGLHEVVAGLDREERVVERDAGHPGQRARQQVLERRLRRRGHRHRVAVAAEAARHPDHVDGELLGLGLARGELERAHARAERSSPRSTSAGDVVGGGPVQDEAVRLARDEPGARQAASACDTDGRSAPTSCPISRCVSGSGTRMPSAIDDAPALGQVPQQQRDARVGARVAGRRAVDVELHRPADRAAQQRVQDLRPRPDALGERLRRGPPRACARARARTSPRRAARRRRRSSTARAGRPPRRARRPCGRRPARRARRRPRRAAARGRRAAAPAAGSGRTRRRRSAPRRAVDHRARDEPHPQVEVARAAPRRRRTGSSSGPGRRRSERRARSRCRRGRAAGTDLAAGRRRAPSRSS